MNGKDAYGREVPLLNDGSERRTASESSSRYGSGSTQAWHSSRRTASIGDLSTPGLDRSDSVSSMTDTPSTPGTLASAAYDRRHELSAYDLRVPPSQNSATRAGTHGAPFSTFPPSAYSNNIPYQALAGSQRFHDTPTTDTMSISPPASGAGPNRRFPCQMAQQFNCNKYFTTSGHAARHCKTHTGEKAERCPKCHKEFARKDNMKQHLKTHEGKEERSASTVRRVNRNTTEYVEQRSQPVSRRVDPTKPSQSLSLIGQRRAIPSQDSIYDRQPRSKSLHSPTVSPTEKVKRVRR
ncbi:MAG: hypothetical protein M4579_003731 [Chaenotheca gracillima]|nr:MAG: hypothetical protein M4579_003731 [Chaenotheca gracillima]